jgi:pimeloyl-ACP methyl ester carboxylesterase
MTTRSIYCEFTERVVQRGELRLTVRTIGDGPSVVLLPSLGRSTQDFNDLARRLAEHNFCAVLPEPRGIAGSTSPSHLLTLHDYAADIALVIDDLNLKRAHFIGHAFGNRVARMFATDYPTQVGKVVLLAGGGMVPIKTEVIQSIIKCFALTLPDEERLLHLQQVFFASGNDASVWLDGWWPDAAAAQWAAGDATPLHEWWLAGSAPILVVEAAEDKIVARANTQAIKAEGGSRVAVTLITGAGHALLPEQPENVARTIIDYLRAA